MGRWTFSVNNAGPPRSPGTPFKPLRPRRTGSGYSRPTSWGLAVQHVAAAVFSQAMRRIGFDGSQHRHLLQPPATGTPARRSAAASPSKHSRTADFFSGSASRPRSAQKSASPRRHCSGSVRSNNSSTAETDSVLVLRSRCTPSSPRTTPGSRARRRRSGAGRMPNASTSSRFQVHALPLDTRPRPRNAASVVLILKSRPSGWRRSWPRYFSRSLAIPNSSWLSNRLAVVGDIVPPVTPATLLIRRRRMRRISPCRSPPPSRRPIGSFATLARISRRRTAVDWGSPAGQRAVGGPDFGR